MFMFLFQLWVLWAILTFSPGRWSSWVEKRNKQDKNTDSQEKKSVTDIVWLTNICAKLHRSPFTSHYITGWDACHRDKTAVTLIPWLLLWQQRNGGKCSGLGISKKYLHGVRKCNLHVTSRSVRRCAVDNIGHSGNLTQVSFRVKVWIC